MGSYVGKNFAHSKLVGSLTSSATSFSVTGGEGVLFPAITGSDYTYLVLTDASGNREIVKATARSTDAFTIVRAQEGTGTVADLVGIAFASGDSVSLRLTSKVVTDAFTSAATAAASAVTAASEAAAAAVSAAASSGTISAHIADTSDAHDASAISNIPAGNIAATDVQAAINELDAEKVPLNGTGATGSSWGISITGSAATIPVAALAALVTAATSKVTPVDADELPLTDSAASFALKKLTWGNLKATLKAYFDTLYGLLGTANVWTKGNAGAVVPLTDAATVAVNLALSNNFSLLTTAGVGASRTLGNPTNIVVGQSGIIAVTTDSTSRVLNLDTYYKTTENVALTLSTTSGAIDLYAYYVVNATHIHISQQKASS